MRIGINPTKINKDVVIDSYHRIIVPVYIPNQEGYFEQSIEVLKLCLKSLVSTIHNKASITIIDNGCCQEAKYVIEQFSKKGQIDQVVRNQKNLGKINSLVPILKGAWEPLLTIADADVLFEKGWIQAIEKGFDENRKLGFLSPCPTPFSWKYETQTTLLQGIINGNFNLISKIEKEKMLLFPASIGQKDLYEKKSPNLLSKQLIFRMKNTDFIVGSGHFVATLHKDVIKYIPKSPAQSKMRGGTMRDYIDLPVEKAGLLRLSIDKLLAHHIGNVPEQWMYETLTETTREDAEERSYLFQNFTRRKSVFAYFPYQLRRYMGKVAKWYIKLKFKI